ncbi:MAG: globin [Gammaproteobacteria bacterium]|nr:globin [Gammaproteobacteria bacterium]
MSYETIFDQSFERVKKIFKNKQSFFDAFYGNFINASPEVAKLFGNTGMAHQAKMMEKSFYGLFVFYATQNANDYLEKIAFQHSFHNLDIKPELFDLWLENLIKTVEDFDPQCSDEVTLSWRVVLSPGITYMKHKYSR